MSDESILNSTKKVLNQSPEYTAFDPDVMMFINSALATLLQLIPGMTPVVIISADEVWADLGLPPDLLALVRTFVYLKSRSEFDPPSNSFLVDAMTKQITEYEWRINTMAEGAFT